MIAPDLIKSVKLPRTRVIIFVAAILVLLSLFLIFDMGSAAPFSWTHTQITVSNNIGIRTESPDSLTVLDATRSGADTYIKSRNTSLGAYFQTQSGVLWAGYNMLDNTGATATYFGYRGSTQFRVFDSLAGEDRILMAAAGTANGDIYLNPSNTGDVGIGTTSPARRLHITNSSRQIGLEGSTASLRYDIWAGSGSFSLDDPNAGTEPFFIPYGAPDATITSDTSGNVGIGTWSADAGLEVAREDSVTGYELALTDSGSDHPKMLFDHGGVAADWEFGVNPSNGTFYVRRTAGGDSIDIYSDGTIAFQYLAASTTTHLCMNGSTLAGCSSAAEYVPTVNSGMGFPEGGDLVSLVPDAENPYGDDHATFVTSKSAKPCDPNLVGFVLDPASGADGQKVNDHYLPLAIYGYFPVKVTMEGGSIRRGDGITSSSTTGMGMTATQACRIVGYALEDANEDGTIMVFAHLTDYIPSDILSSLNALFPEN